MDESDLYFSGDDVNVGNLINNGWETFQIPWVDEELWEAMLASFGESGVTYRIIAMAVRPQTGERSGMFMVAPEAVSALKDGCNALVTKAIANLDNVMQKHVRH